jgi:multidrug transporter EmrE-like cation transporter
VLAATLLALGSAAIHAAWNLLIKTSTGDRRIATWGVFLCGAALATPVLLAIGLPGWEVLPWLVLHESMGAKRLVSAGVILAGLVALVASGG